MGRTARMRFALLLSGALMVWGCSLAFPVYSPSGKNVQAIRSLPTNVKLGQFLGDEKSVSCRLQPIAPESGETFASYIKSAFNEDMIMAGGKATTADLPLAGTLKNIDVDCGIISASWIIEMELTIGTHPPFMVKTVHPFDGNYFGGIVFQRAYTAFVPAVQRFINDVVTHPTFQEAVRQGK